MARRGSHWDRSARVDGQPSRCLSHRLVAGTAGVQEPALAGAGGLLAVYRRG